jgi:CheY-like chemotaxis protein
MTNENSAPPIPVSNWTLATGTQTGRRVHRAVVVASCDPDNRAAQAALSAEDCDIVFVESPANAYSQVKRILPNLVVVCLEMDDVAAFHVLSMLKLDSATSHIPVITYITMRDAHNVGCDLRCASGLAYRQVTASPMQ